MRKLATFIVGVSAMALAVMVVTGVGTASQGPFFGADLHGGAEVPPVTTEAMGMATVNFKGDLTLADYRLEVVNAMNITQVHIHCGAAGANGPVAVLLAGGPAGPGVMVGGLWTKMGDFMTADIIMTPCGGTLAEFAAAMDAGNTYVNVHTTAHPPGEVRGQLMLQANGDEEA
ncbi:MAG: CHRD domain-containing protein [Dehalococcoidia bacterium]